MMKSFDEKREQQLYVVIFLVIELGLVGDGDSSNVHDTSMLFSVIFLIRSCFILMKASFSSVVVDEIALPDRKKYDRLEKGRRQGVVDASGACASYAYDGVHDVLLAGVCVLYHHHHILMKMDLHLIYSFCFCLFTVAYFS